MRNKVSVYDSCQQSEKREKDANEIDQMLFSELGSEIDCEPSILGVSSKSNFYKTVKQQEENLKSIFELPTMKPSRT